MKLDVTALRYLTSDDFRILTALELGSKNHQVVPLSMVANLARLRPGQVNNRLSELAKLSLVVKEHQTGYEGFRLTYGGYDYLALHALSQRGTVTGVGRQIGVGKESDVFLVSGRFTPEAKNNDKEEKRGDNNNNNDSDIDIDIDNGVNNTPLSFDHLPDNSPLTSGSREETFVLKLQRLGRTSFRTVKTNRDYHGRRKHVSWLYLSRLAAEKEWSFLRALYRHGFPTPRPVDWSRHGVVMEWIDGRVLEQIRPEEFGWEDTLLRQRVACFLFNYLMALVVKLAEYGLVHGDFNEFNLLVRESFLNDPLPWLDEDVNIEIGNAGSPTLRTNSVNHQSHKKDSDSKPIPSPVVIIDFPQMISTQHRNAAEQFDRDITCLRIFFKRRFAFDALEWPDFNRDVQSRVNLDGELRASGYSRRNKGRHEEEEEEYEDDDDDDDDDDEDEDDENSNDNDNDNEKDDDNNDDNDNQEDNSNTKLANKLDYNYKS